MWVPQNLDTVIGWIIKFYVDYVFAIPLSMMAEVQMPQLSFASLIADYLAKVQAMYAKMFGLIDWILSIPEMYKDQIEAQAASSW